MVPGKFNCIVDAAWGSSAKGAASTRLVDLYKVENASTCNYMNAGHTAVHSVKKFVSKVIPTPSFLNSVEKGKPKLWVGPGSAFFLEQFSQEVDFTGYAKNEVIFHERSVVADQRHIDAESPTGGQSTEHISSTMSGSGAAYTEKAMRRQETQLVRDMSGLTTLQPMDFMRAVRAELQQGHSFMHEVSQGFALSINHGTHYPHCTFRDCTPQQAYSDFCITKEFIGDIYLNVRSFTIRVGNNYRDGIQVGYSGDFYDDQTEMTWEQIAKDAEFPAEEAAGLAERERTTVTKKIRRVATQSWTLLKDAAQATGATKLILNFPQYIHWSAYKVRGGHEVVESLHPKVRAYMDKMEDTTGLPLVMVGTSAEHDDYIWLG